MLEVHTYIIQTGYKRKDKKTVHKLQRFAKITTGYNRNNRKRHMIEEHT